MYAVVVGNYATVSLRNSFTEISNEALNVRLSVVNGRSASTVPLVAYHRLPHLTSPWDTIIRWKHSRGGHDRFFGLPGEGSSGSPGQLSRALTNCLHALDVQAPAQGNFTSHSLRIGAHTEQVLLGIPLDVRLSRFGWGPRSGEMANTYFDRTIQTTAASYWGFGPTVQSALPASAAFW